MSIIPITAPFFDTSLLNKNSLGGANMPDYAAMYRRLLNVQTEVIEILQEAHLAVEEMYISAPDIELTLFTMSNDSQPDDK